MTHNKKILKYLKFKNTKPSTFYRTCGVSNGFLDSGNSFSTDKLGIILDNCRGLNIKWLIHDEGNVLLWDTNTINELHQTYGKSIKDLLYNQIEKI
jgi:hypothetical protein